MDKIDTLDDCIHFLRCANYWGMEGIPLILFEYVLEESRIRAVTEYIENHMKDELQDQRWDILMLLMEFRDECFNKNVKVCDWTARKGYLDCMRYAHEHGCPWDVWTCSYAARNGHLSCLQYAHDHGCPWNEWTCSYAAENGHLSCLQYARDHGCPWNDVTT